MAELQYLSIPSISTGVYLSSASQMLEFLYERVHGCLLKFLKKTELKLVPAADHL